MPDIKFRCPECAQKIAVDSSAAGVRIDCPSCKSTLVIPVAADAAVEVVQRRKLAIVAGSADALYEQITSRQKELDDAVAESRRLREEAEKLRLESQKAREDGEVSRLEKDRISAEAEKLRSDLGAVLSERDSLKKRESELAFQASVEADTEKQFQKLSADLAEALRERDELTAKLAAVDSLRDALTKVEQERESVRGELELARIELKAAVSNSGVTASKWDENRKAMDRLREQLETMTTERDSLKLNAEKAVASAATEPKRD
jgi:chromosome segregation ATPase/DNA-directed RNA polymerase subunit RPC12/RpoP